MGAVDILILAVVAVLVALAARYSFRHRNEECGHSCAGCPYHADCRKKGKG